MRALLLILALAARPLPAAGVFHGCRLEGSAQAATRQALNRLKNRATAPATFAATTLEDLYAPGDDTRRFSPTTAMRVQGWITHVKAGGIESVNCQATDPRWRDTHLELKRSRTATELPIIVEVSPRWRAAMAMRGVDWSTPALTTLTGHFVEIEGWPLFDAEHANASENTHPGGRANWRQSAWEPAHPVTAITVLQ